MEDISVALEGAARANAPTRTSNLVRNIQRANVHRTGANTFQGAIGVNRQAPYGLFVEEGTGIFRPGGHPITPKSGRWLVFRDPGTVNTFFSNQRLFHPRRKGLVFARSVRGQRPQPFMEEAYHEIVRTYAPARLEKLKQEIARLGT